MKRVRLMGRGVICCLLLLCLCIPALAQEENLVKNGGFETLSGEFPKDWMRGMWVTTQGASYLEISQEAPRTGDYCVLVENVQDNDARFEQTVAVKENTLYKLSAYVRAEDIPSGTRGANISFADVYETSNEAFDTQGEWRELTVYARTGKGKTSLTVMLRVGGYSSLNSGRAWFDDVTLTEVDKAPEGATVISLTTPAPQKESAQAKAPGEPGNAQVAMLFAGALAFALLALLAMRYLRKADDRRFGIALTLTLALAFALRCVLAVLVPGYEVDINCFWSWSNTVYTAGPSAFYETVSFCDYPPAYLFVLWVNGFLMKLFGTPHLSAGSLLIIKGLPMLADIACAALLYVIGRKKIGNFAAYLLASLYALCPATIVISACWGQIDAVFVLLVVLVIYFAARKDFRWAIPLYALAALTKPQAFLFAPLGIGALVIALLPKDTRGALAKQVGVGVGIALVVAAVVILPFTGNQPFGWLIEKYADTLSSYNYATLSTGNLVFLLGGNWVSVQTPVLFGISYSALGWTLMIASIVFVLVLMAKGKDLSLLFEQGALLLLLLCTLGVKMHERYFLPVLALLLFAFFERRDRRLLWAFLALTATMSVNCGIVLLFEHLVAPNLWAGYLCGGINLAACALLSWTAIDHVRKAPRVQETCAYSAPELLEDTQDRYGAQFMEEMAQTDGGKRKMRGRDWLLVGVVTLIYACVAFVNLGSMKAPQTGYVSTASKECVIFDLGQVREDFYIYYYGGISDVQFEFATSQDGQTWTQDQLAQFGRGDCFRWIAHRNPQRDDAGNIRSSNGETLWESGRSVNRGRYVRVTFDSAGAQLWEVGFVKDGAALPIVSTLSMGAVESRAGNPKALWDEQDSVPDVPGYYYGTYFDEIYHARTAYEHLHGINPYETTHPPLGKIFIALGVQLFGMTPFGWRFMGTLFGVLMLPLMYLLGKQLFRGKTMPALLAMVLFACDCMHFTQTRIATIDTYAVFFIMAMYLCMFCWMRTNFMRDSLAKTFVPLGLSGLFMGCAIASKWIGLYAAVGLAVLFFWRLYALVRQFLWAQAHGDEEARMRSAKFQKGLLLTLACCVVFFVLLPLIIYCLSYIPHLAPSGAVDLTSMGGLANYVQRVWNAQVSMLGYHSRLVDDHYFQSPWWQWPLMLKPMWYYNADFKPEGMMSSLSAFGNPAVWWTGLAAMLFVFGYALKRAMKPVLGLPKERDEDVGRVLVFLIIGFLSQYLPWAFVPRSTFIYHYFASVPFIILAIAFCYTRIEKYNVRLARGLAFALMGLALALFIGFYPLASGAMVPRSWGDAVVWINHWIWY